MIAASGLEVVGADGVEYNKCEGWLGRTVQYGGMFRIHVTYQVTPTTAPQPTRFYVPGPHNYLVSTPRP